MVEEITSDMIRLVLNLKNNFRNLAAEFMELLMKVVMEDIFIILVDLCPICMHNCFPMQLQS